MKPILKPGHNCWKISDAGTSGLLIDGDNYYRAFFEAARQARRYILIAGWQLDSDVCLLRGRDAKKAQCDVTLLRFLDSLCERNPALRVHLLAWDFNVFYALKREFLQAWWFNWKTNARLQFRFDSSHPLGACHHQKFAIIDGRVAFAGGMDLCCGFWDDRRHLVRHPHRIEAKKKHYAPRHDVQAFVAGRAAGELVQLFRRRWRFAGGGILELPEVKSRSYVFESGLPILAPRVAISRTQGKTITPRQDSIREIRNLYCDAIDAAEELIYIENQYFSSLAIYRALLRRMKARERSRLQVIVVLPRQPEDLIEEVGLGSTQARYLRSLRRVSAHTGHVFQVFNTLAAGRNRRRQRTYIHSKMMIVDDQFLTVGSANFANRCMGFDSELNLAWQSDEEVFKHCLRQTRLSLWAEHCGLPESLLEPLVNGPRAAKALDELAASKRSRLRRHQIGRSVLSDWLTNLTPHDLIIDPRRSVLAERLEELMMQPDSLFAKGITLLNRWLYNQRGGAQIRPKTTKITTIKSTNPNPPTG